MSRFISEGKLRALRWKRLFQYVNEFHENVLGFCNNIYNAEGGTHLTGFKTTFTTVMNQYARELGILKGKGCELYRSGYPKRYDSDYFYQASGSQV